MALFGRAKRHERRGTPYDALVVGLGNPGKQYEGSRHNVGFDAITGLAVQCATTLKSGRDRALVAETRIDDKRIVLAMPTTFMNESGNAVAPLARRFGIDEPSRLIVVHDELDLEPGVVRVKVGGGLAGHNGLRSIAHHLKNQDFIRVRIGVGKPPSKERGADHVLSRLSALDQRVLNDAVAVAVEAVTLIVRQGVDHAMHTINGR
jgi:PTH1 family peptidyl-tRNA hydrolase